MLVSSYLLGASATILEVAFANPAILYLGVAAWGLGFGGSATLFVTAGIRAAGTDGFQALVVTVFNLSIAAGGVFGGLLLAGLRGVVHPLGVRGDHDPHHRHRCCRAAVLVPVEPEGVAVLGNGAQRSCGVRSCWLRIGLQLPAPVIDQRPACHSRWVSDPRIWPAATGGVARSTAISFAARRVSRAPHPEDRDLGLIKLAFNRAR